MEQEIIKICEQLAEETDSIKHNYDRNTKLSIENGIDSLVFMNILIRLEQKYGISIDEHIEEVAKAETIGDIVDLICFCMEDYCG